MVDGDGYGLSQDEAATTPSGYTATYRSSSQWGITSILTEMSERY